LSGAYTYISHLYIRILLLLFFVYKYIWRYIYERLFLFDKNIVIRYFEILYVRTKINYLSHNKGNRRKKEHQLHNCIACLYSLYETAPKSCIHVNYISQRFKNWILQNGFHEFYFFFKLAVNSQNSESYDVFLTLAEIRIVVGWKSNSVLLIIMFFMFCFILYFVDFYFF
jgi:hypothetical protein